MTLSAPMRCTALAEELDEPMIGTVDQRRRWLLVEDRGAWGSDAVADVLGADRAARFKAAGMRALLIRRREGDPAADALRRVILVDTDGAQMATRSVTSLDELEPASLASRPLAEFGDLLSEPIFLVCANGKRDTCCALRGRVVLAALAAEHPGRVWECTHLGGHRFAANLVCLPHGIVYGRVPPADAPRLASGYRDGRLYAPLLRGRSAWPGPAQVAEQQARLEDVVDGIDDVELVSADLEGDRARVTLAVSGTPRDFVLQGEPMPPPRKTSCRGEELEEPLHWRVVQARTPA